MGYGEYIGGGSVQWRVQHGEPAHPGSNGVGGKPGGVGRDEDGTRSRFRVYVNGVLVSDVDCDTGRVVVVWGRHLATATPNGDPDVANVAHGKALEKAKSPLSERT